MRQEILTIKGTKVDQVIKEFYQTFQPSAKLLLAKGKIQVYILEKYYFRTRADVAATLLFELKDQDTLIIHIVIAGGTDMFGISLGAQNSFLKKLRAFFDKFSDK